MPHYSELLHRVSNHPECVRECHQPCCCMLSNSRPFHLWTTVRECLTVLLHWNKGSRLSYNSRNSIRRFRCIFWNATTREMLFWGWTLIFWEETRIYKKIRIFCWKLVLPKKKIFEIAKKSIFCDHNKWSYKNLITKTMFFCFFLFFWAP